MAPPFAAAASFEQVTHTGVQAGPAGGHTSGSRASSSPRPKARGADESEETLAVVEALRGTVHRMTMEARQRDAQHEAVKAKVHEQVALMTAQQAKVG